MNRVPLAAADLFAAWMMHDLEELATVSKASRNLVTRLPDRVPGPVRVRDQGLTNRHIAADIATVGTVIAAATVGGHRTQGRSTFYQNTGTCTERVVASVDGWATPRPGGGA